MTAITPAVCARKRPHGPVVCRPQDIRQFVESAEIPEATIEIGQLFLTTLPSEEYMSLEQDAYLTHRQA